MKEVELREICDVIAGQSPPSSTYNQDGLGVPFFQGKADFGDNFPKVRYWCTEPKKFTSPGDLLFSLRAPVGPTNFNQIEASIGRGLAAIRCGDKIDVNFLRYYFIHNEDKIEALGNGSTFKAITNNTLKALKVPLPPLEEQKRIAGILDEADLVRKKTQALIDKYDELAQSLFLDMFGDPVTNPKGWEVLRLSDIGELNRGRSKHRPRNAPELLGGEHPLIQTGDLSSCNIYLRHYETTYSDFGLSQSKKWPAGTLCITIAANIAKTGILTFDACFPDSVVGFTPNDKSINEYVLFWLGFMQESIERNAPESAQKNINLNILRNLKLPVPPRGLQIRFKQALSTIENSSTQLSKSRIQQQYLFDSILQKSFSSR